MTDIKSVSDYGSGEINSIESIRYEDWILELEDIEKDSGMILDNKQKKSEKLKMSGTVLIMVTSSVQNCSPISIELSLLPLTDSVLWR